MTIPQIKKGELHIWWANLRHFNADIPRLRSVLSSSEEARAGRFRFIHDRKNYIVRHGILRILLGNYMGQSPSSLSFATGEYGRPELRSVPSGRKIHFNVSHSGDVALYGITGACPIGVDVERVRPVPLCERIAAEFFLPAEFESVMATAEEIRPVRFLELWTRKEALLKATGVGIGIGLTSQETLPAEPISPRLAHAAQASRTSEEFRVHSFSPWQEYIAAAAYFNADLKLICMGISGFSPEDFCVSFHQAVKLDIRNLAHNDF